jgi:hypothetical protein
MLWAVIIASSAAFPIVRSCIESNFVMDLGVRQPGFVDKAKVVLHNADLWRLAMCEMIYDTLIVLQNSFLESVCWV